MESFKRDLFALFLLISCVFAVCTGETTLSDSACYGTNPDCDFYTLSCNTDEIIRLRDLTVGYKAQTECRSVSHCNISDTCCNADVTNDVTDVFNLKNTFDAYKNCSGKSKCTSVQSPWQLINSTFTSTYVNMEYACVRESNTVNFCGSQTDDFAETKSSNSVHVLFDSRKQNRTVATPMDCRCTVTASNGISSNFSMELVDVRLHSYETIGNTSQQYNCSTSHIASQMYNRSCVNSTNHHEDNFQYGETIDWNAPSGDFYLNSIYSMGVLDAPAMVWLQITAADVNSVITVSCNQIFPETTTPSTTSTTSSTTSTTPSSTSTTPSTTTTTSSTSTIQQTTIISPATSTSSVQTTVSAGSFTGDDNDVDDFDNVRLYLVIFIPVGCLVIIPFLCIGIWKYRQKKRGGKQLKYLKSDNGLRSFRDSRILDRFIYDITKMDISADSPAVFDEEKEVKSQNNPLFVSEETPTRIGTISNSVAPPKYSSNNLSTMMKNSHFSGENRNSQTGVSVVGAVNTDFKTITQNGGNAYQPKTDNQSVVKQNGTGVVIRVNYDKDPNVEPTKTNSQSQQAMVKSPKHLIEELSDGGILVRIGSKSDNRNDARNEMNTNQTGNGPAIIVPETNEERLSATAHVLPGQSKGEENSVLFVNKSIRKPT